MAPPGLRIAAHLPKSVVFLTGFALISNGELMPRWLLILGAVALIAMAAGFFAFGGANMGR
jgi:hypothetical protein